MSEQQTFVKNLKVDISMKVTPQTGIDSILLGMDMDEVRALWGQPKEIENFIPLKGNSKFRDVEWIYSNGTQLSFGSDDNFLLSSIGSNSVELELFGKKVIGKTLSELKLNFPQIELDDDFEEVGQDYILPELDISFWVIDGIVDNISLTPKYDETGNIPIWPKK